MKASVETTHETGISRREAIRRAALLAGVALSPAWLSLVDRATSSAQATYLTDAHRVLAGAVADRILPRTDTPGAVDVGVPAFIDRLFGEFMTDGERQMLTSGLSAVDAAGRAAHGGASFSTLTGAQQDAVLRTIAKTEAAQPQGFFGLFRSATILGYFSSEQVGRNVLHYDPIPGRFDACVPLSEIGNRNWTT